MSQENFDKLFKNKLSEINPQYEASVWKRISGKLPHSPVVLDLKTAGLWIYGTATTTILIWLALQMQDLRKETHFLRESLFQAKNNLKMSSMAFERIKNRKSDTIYLVQNEEIHYSEKDKPNNTELIKKSESLSNPTFINSKSKRYLNPNRNNNFEKVAQNNPTKNNSDFRTSLKDLEMNKIQTNNPLTISKSPKEIIAENLKDTMAMDSTQAKSKIENLLVKSQKESNILKTDSTIGKIENNVKTKTKSSFRLSDLSPKIGIGIIAGTQNTIGFGPDFEFTLGRNLGLSLGIFAFKGIEYDFVSSSKFNEATGYDFHKVFEGNILKDNGPIHEINIISSVIELPLRLKYYTRVSDKVDLIFSGGTHFNITSNERVRYEVIQNNEELYNTFSYNSQQNVFHNFTLGLGIQKKGQNVNWQLSPMYTYNFRQSGLFESKSIFGITLSAWIKLYKD